MARQLKSTVVLLAVLLLLAAAMATGCGRGDSFNPVRLSLLCVAAAYAKRLTNPAGSAVQDDLRHCALACSGQPDCRAFSFDAAHCNLYVWSRCHTAVRQPNCTAATLPPEARNVTVYIKAGNTCPSDYRVVNATGGYRGNRYKFYSATATWAVQAARCLADGALTRPAQLDNVDDIDAVSIAYGGSRGTPVWTGAVQVFNSSEPAGGWHWHPCAGPNPPLLPIQAAVWDASQPINNGGTENVGVMLQRKLSDYPETDSYPIVCQCSDPFNLA